MSKEEQQHDQPSIKSPEHAEIQRNRILDAAQQCFIERGFHAASIANISEKAQMSAGLIYRYFANKSAIILSIIERQLQERRTDIATLQTNTDLMGRIRQLFSCWQHCDASVMNPALFLEMSAEATRDPQIARALGNSDRLTRSDFSVWLKQTARAEGVELTDEDVRSRAFALQAFVEGLLIRAVREPETDCCVLIQSMQPFLSHLLTFKK